MPSSTAPPPRTYDASRRQADAVTRRRRVVDAARDLFLEQGYGETSISEIARRADVSTQTVYAAFDSKAGVLAKVVDVVIAGDYLAVEQDDGPTLSERHEGIEELSDPDLRRRLATAVHYAAVGHARSASILHLVETTAGTDPAIAELAAGLVAAIRRDIGVVGELPDGALRVGLDRDTAADLTFHLLGWRAFHSFTRECGWTISEYEERVADALVQVLLADGQG